MMFLHDESLSLPDIEDLLDLTEHTKVEALCGYEDDGIMHLETIEKLEAIAAHSTALLLIEDTLCRS